MSRSRLLGFGALAVLLVVLAASCGGSDGNASAAAGPSTFAYDAARPLQLREYGLRDVGIHDVTYVSGRDRVDAYLVEPRRSGRRPAVIYLHGAGGDREQLLDRAREAADRGAVALTLTAPSSVAQPPAALGASDALDWQRDLTVRDVVAVRRAVDLLATLPNVDDDHIGFVGWSAGARTGAILAGVERRIDAFVLMSAGAVPVESYAAAAPADLRSQVRTVLGEVDPLRYIARAPAEALLLQAGSADRVVPRHALVRLARTAPRGADVRWYADGHALGPVAYVEQLDWIAGKLALDERPRRWRPAWR